MHDGEVDHGDGEKDGVFEASNWRHDANQQEQGQYRSHCGDQKRTSMTCVEEVPVAQVVFQQRTVRGLRVEEAIGDVDEPGSDAEDRDCRDVCVKLS